MAKVFLRAYNREIETMIDRGQLDEAIAHCHHILKTYPKHLETYRLLGKAYLEYKRYGDAADIFSRILVSVPNDFVAQVGMSIIRDEENKLDDAIWHMERAFETQPSNSAIQSELQRLYGRRDGVQPPRIRMTRGALSHMYVQGELYPQAISEIKSVLKDDPERSDMQALLTRAYYKSGLKNDAADVASALLRRYPYSLDANRVLADILGVDRPENAQVYRQRVVELDPYAAQVTGTIFQSSDVSDAAVTLERLDWNGQPVGGIQPDWAETRAINLEGSMPDDEQPDWMRSSSTEMTPPPTSQPTPAPIFDTPASPAQTPSESADDIPDFLRQAGWGQSSGTVDESKSIFSEEEAAPSPTLEQGDLPDWVKAMKPAEPVPQQEAEEELPDWINKIGAGAISSQASDDQPDWMKQPESSSEPFISPAEDQPDWMQSLESTPESTVPDAQADDSDWLKGLGSEPELTQPAAQAEDLDWLKELGSEPVAPSAAEQTDEPDWLKGFAAETEPEAASPTAQEDQPDWLNQFSAETESTPSTPATTDFDFLDQLTEEPILQTPVESTPSSTDVDNLGVSEQERDDSFAWLEALAAKQGASEGLLTKPEDRLQEEPDWVKQAKGLSTSQPPASVESPVNEPSVSAGPDELGKSDQERDDSFAWLENLAAKQGASEGLLTQPEERLEQEPDWVKQARDLEAQQPSVNTSPEANLDELGKSEQERDDSFEWLENLAAKQDASEDLLTKPEERLEQEPDWVRQAKDLEMQQPSVTTPPAANLEDLGKSEQERDDSFAWLENLAAKQGASEGLLTQPEERLEQEPEWVRQAKDLDSQQQLVTSEVEPEPVSAIDDTVDTTAWLENLDAEEKPSKSVPVKDEIETWLENLEGTDVSTPEQPAESFSTDLPAWMNEIGTEEVVPAAESTVPEKEAENEFEWATPAEEPVAFAESRSEEALPSWLSELDKEEPMPDVAGGDDLPAWLRGEETAPEKPEPMHATDWKPFEEKRPEIIYSPPLEEEETKEPEPEMSGPSVSFEAVREKILDLVEEKPVEARQPESKPEPQPIAPIKPTPTPEPYREPVTRSRGTGIPVTPSIDAVLGLARNELSRSNVPAALESYGKLIKKGRFLDEVIYDLRDTLYRYPVDVSIWQSLGDAYMRANRLQDALDAYTKAEELLR